MLPRPVQRLTWRRFPGDLGKMGENRRGRAACTIVGVVVLLEALALLAVGAFAGIVGGLAGALAFVAGGGGASAAKVTQTFAVIAITLASPFVVAAVLGLAGVLLLMRKKRWVIVASGVFAIAAQIAFHPLFVEPFHLADMGLFAIQFAAIAVGFAVVPAPARA